MFSLYKELCLGLRMFIPQYSYLLIKLAYMIQVSECLYYVT